MIKKNPQQWERIDRFLMSFSPKEKIAIIHDADPDGLCSAVIMSRLIGHLRGKPADLHLTPPKGIRNTIHPDTFSKLKKHNIAKVIFTDLVVHEDAAAIKKLEKQCEVLIIDHHTFFQDITSERSVLAMPHLLADDIDPSRYPASKMAYDLAQRHATVEGNDWIATIGTISDMAGKEWTEFISKVFEKYKLKPNTKDWFRSELGSISGMFFAAMTIDEKNVDYCFDVLMRSKKPQDVLKDKKLKSLRKTFDKEITIWMKKAPKLMEKNDKLKLIWYETRPKYRVNSPIGTILSLKPQYYDWVVIILEKDKHIVRVSARCQGRRVKVNELLKNATNGLKDAAGGGHIPAAGAHVRPADLNVFKKRILDALTKNLYTTK